MIAFDVKIDGFAKLAETVEDSVTKKVATKTRAAVTMLDTLVHERTPVWSGEAVRNMIWSIDNPAEAAFDPIKEPSDPGNTSAMALGSEPRRAANESAARETLDSLKFDDPFHTFILHNMAGDIDVIENGQSGPPGKTRAPNGVFAISVADVIVRLSSGVHL